LHMTDICCGMSMVLLNLCFIFLILLKVLHMENGIEIFVKERYKDKAEKYITCQTIFILIFIICMSKKIKYMNMNTRK